MSWQRYCTASSSGRQPNFAALNRGRHLCSAGRPSGWALAHILVLLCLTIPTVGQIEWSLLPSQQSHISCHSSKQKLETHGKSSHAGSFILVIGKERADFAALSALSLPRILTWLGIQHKMIVLPLLARWVSEKFLNGSSAHYRLFSQCHKW